jgi:excinuclease ABC subunit C
MKRKNKVNTLKDQVALMSRAPGVYLLLNDQKQVLYVGKARNLKKRLYSYFREQKSRRIAALMQQVTAIETTTTETENQALLLESNLIKELKPRYNILLRDDKSYPYLILTNHRYPRLSFYRGPRQKTYRYFGPYPSTHAVRETLNLLQKIFRIRSCQDSFFAHRSRPCLQYQINRCTAPCVELITPEAYQAEVERVALFLEGKSQTLIQNCIQQMEHAAQQEEYEIAARLRDQIIALRSIQQKQVITRQEGDIDIIGLASHLQHYAIYVAQVRSGRLLGGKSYFPKVPNQVTSHEVLTAFITQFYLQANTPHVLPDEIIIPYKIVDSLWVSQALSERAQRKIKLSAPVTGDRRQWLNLAAENAQQALSQQCAQRTHFRAQLEALQTALQWDNLPHRLECFDISHTQGEATVAACVVFDENGPRKSEYRRFNIENIQPGDDYAALNQALLRRYRHLKSSVENTPDVVLIDGGKGQLKQAQLIFERLQIQNVVLMSIAKGPERKPGVETLFLSEANGFAQPIKKKNITKSRLQSTQWDLPIYSPARLALQVIRDEAHRFAVTGHRKRRAQKRRISSLERISGIGPKKRQHLLQQFGGLHALKSASVDDLIKVPGISKALAKRIYFALKD